jgi:hypothetical protein
VNLYVVRRGNQCSHVLIGMRPMGSVLGLTLYMLYRTQVAAAQGRYVGFYVAINSNVQTGRTVGAHALLVIHSSLLLHHLSVAIVRLHVNLYAVNRHMSLPHVLIGIRLMANAKLLILCLHLLIQSIHVQEPHVSLYAADQTPVEIGSVEVVNVIES